jgi:hypothetical protein
VHRRTDLEKEWHGNQHQKRPSEAAQQKLQQMMAAHERNEPVTGK